MEKSCAATSFSFEKHDPSISQVIILLAISVCLVSFFLHISFVYSYISLFPFWHSSGTSPPHSQALYFIQELKIPDGDADGRLAKGSGGWYIDR